MRPPPLLLAAALLFWGWQTDLLKLSALMAVILECSRVTRFRWDFSDDDFARLWTFCTLLFLGTAAYAFTANEGPSRFMNFFENPTVSNTTGAGNASALAAAAFFRWLPMTFFLFVAAQVFSTRNEIPMSTISLIMRLRWKRAARLGRPIPVGRGINVAYPYFAICLFSASIHDPGVTNWYFWGLCILLTWALWTQRSRRFSAIAWTCTLALAVVLGYFGQYGIAQVASYLGRVNPPWFVPSGKSGTSAQETSTSIGKVGRLKLSSAILIRLASKEGPPPPYLREATYRAYTSEKRSWLLGRSLDDFSPVIRDGDAWELVPRKNNLFRVQISCYLDPSGDVLPLPEDCGQLENIATWTAMTKNSAGAVRVEGPGLAIFDAAYGPGPKMDSPPDESDEYIPAEETNALAEVAAQLNLRDKDFATKLRAVNGFFQSKFSYTTWLERPRSRQTNETDLARFLLRTRRGHCEYFATATALLLRELKIPTRYAVGYAVHEKSGSGYVVRGRDAHAWCLVWNESRQAWQDFDTTPASWVSEEAKSRAPLQWLLDAWEWGKFQFSKFRWGQTQLRLYLILILVPVLVLLLFQIFYRRKRTHKLPAAFAQNENRRLPGLDSEFYLIEKQLAAKTIPRRASEPLTVWLERATREAPLTPMRPALKRLLRLHYRCRFDPRGLTPDDREELKREAAEILKTLERN